MAGRRVLVWKATYDVVQRFRELVSEYKWHDPDSDAGMALREEILALPGFPAECRRDIEMGLEPVIMIEPVGSGKAWSDLGGVDG